jgi:hypothetical protein
MDLTKDNPDVYHDDDAGPVGFQNEVHAEKNAPPAELQSQISRPQYTVWGSYAKIWIMFLVSASALISPFGATTFFPALSVLTDVLDITPTQLNISVTTYMVRRSHHVPRKLILRLN